MFEGELVRLRGFRAADREVFVARDRDPAPLDVDAPYEFRWGDADAERFLDELPTVPNERYHFAVERIDGDELVGRAALWTGGLPHRYGSFGLYLFEGERGQGYGTDTIRLLLEFGFRGLNLHRIGLDVRADNARAKALYERLGFVTEVVQREQIVVDGSHQDEILMGMLRREWEARR